MELHLQALRDRLERLGDLTTRLADENRELRRQLAAATVAQHSLQAQMSQARARVESALARLPLLDAPPEPVMAAGHDGAAATTTPVPATLAPASDFSPT